VLCRGCVRGGEGTSLVDDPAHGLGDPNMTSRISAAGSDLEILNPSSKPPGSRGPRQEEKGMLVKNWPWRQ
jgi:hypothetical protein